MTNLLLILLLLVGCSEDAPIETNEESYSFLGDWEIIEFSIWSQNDYSDQACSESYDLSNECQGDFCELFIHISEEYMYWEECVHINAISNEECANYLDTTWYENSNSCGICSNIFEYEITLMNDNQICINEAPQCGDDGIKCSTVYFSENGNILDISFIEDQFICEDLNNCQNNLSHEECEDYGWSWDAPVCRYITLERLSNN